MDTQEAINLLKDRCELLINTNERRRFFDRLADFMNFIDSTPQFHKIIKAKSSRGACTYWNELEWHFEMQKKLSEGMKYFAALRNDDVAKLKEMARDLTACLTEESIMGSQDMCPVRLDAQSGDVYVADVRDGKISVGTDPYKYLKALIEFYPKRKTYLELVTFVSPLNGKKHTESGAQSLCTEWKRQIKTKYKCHATWEAIAHRGGARIILT